MAVRSQGVPQRLLMKFCSFCTPSLTTAYKCAYCQKAMMWIRHDCEAWDIFLIMQPYLVWCWWHLHTHTAMPSTPCCTPGSICRCMCWRWGCIAPEKAALSPFQRGLTTRHPSHKLFHLHCQFFKYLLPSGVLLTAVIYETRAASRNTFGSGTKVSIKYLLSGWSRAGVLKQQL